ncbi:hypothetical protein TNCT_682401 [Trichonephila clavata]|uniref:Mos1 transposase HTH domain-containing protein n=1 Tax=Trichonephila clavata TaxID=2740835 RepID=A0A8X6FWA0_TRICU|nr:hypothetical protein TNCT_682401 [Trichonephila clavata]
MEVIRFEQRTCIKIAVVRGRNEMECHSEFVEALGNDTLPYRTIARWVGKFQQGLKICSHEDMNAKMRERSSGNIKQVDPKKQHYRILDRDKAPL